MQDENNGNNTSIKTRTIILFWVVVGAILITSGLIEINMGNDAGHTNIPAEAQTEIDFYEFYATGDDMWGAPYKIGDTVTSIEWFNDTIKHSFSGTIIGINYMDETVTVRATNHDNMVGIGGGGMIHSIEYIKLLRENVWTRTDDPDYIRYEWVATLDGEITRDRQKVDDFVDNTICIDYRVNKLWVKPLNNTTQQYHTVITWAQINYLIFS